MKCFSFTPRSVLGSLSATACLVAAFISPSSLAAHHGEQAKSKTITVYSSRKEHLIKPLFDRYTAQTGTPVRFITDKAGPLMERLKAEGKTTPADIFMTVDAGVLWKASDQGLFRAIDSPSLTSAVPENLRSAKNDWFGLSVRARTIVYSTERVKPAQLSSYEALADKEWKGRLCLRTSKKIYNKSLVATMIKTLGEQKTESLVKGWVENLALPPFSNDTKTCLLYTSPSPRDRG